ncbi:hypothetical protein EIN_425110 [Entamoeba invadens IP1]|uniref:Uncharacterized protein n=1 Tax=Entamoeba invadens IP1 TaxID=370355 RepID=A0A0A1UBV7_ENTIV|nr:hypothetical protein EIN_425110 [Entamoeba invadens IP1]ELP89789.1 hypothetical protein EIN_425110 [Entamoeba invadens IP1]|eukprot:XP_004256560.1 hypothetical protein EIN_425110 [Entamoeba invadens IP1]
MEEKEKKEKIATKPHPDETASRIRVKKCLYEQLTKLSKKMGKKMTTNEIVELLYKDFVDNNKNIKQGTSLATTPPPQRVVGKEFFLSGPYYELLFEGLYYSVFFDLFMLLFHHFSF